MNSISGNSSQAGGGRDPNTLAMFAGMEDISTASPADPVDYEQVLYQALVNEGKHTRVLNTKRQSFTYSEKQLRDAAAAEVAAATQSQEEADKASKKRKQMSAEEKSKQNRDRNREHARNTRLRKKAYVSKLKELVEQLTHQKNVEVKERIALGKRIHDTQVLRKNAVRLFLSYRAANVQDTSKWSTILDEDFVLTMPITPYRAFNKTEVVNSQRVMYGINAVIADTASLALMVENVGLGTPAWVEAIRKGQGCRIWYEVGGKREILASGDVVICRFFMRTEGHDMVGAPTSLTKCGMLQCKFNKANKMISGEMVFDVMGFMQQYQRAAMLSPENSIVPNSIEMALQPSKDARLIASVYPPYGVTHMNAAWWELKGESSPPAENTYKDRPLFEVMEVSSTSEMLTRQPTISDHLNALLPRVCRGIPVRLPFSSTRPDGTSVLIYITALPLVNESLELTYMMITKHQMPLPAPNPSEAESVFVGRFPVAGAHPSQSQGYPYAGGVMPMGVPGMGNIGVMPQEGMSLDSSRAPPSGPEWNMMNLGRQHFPQYGGGAPVPPSQQQQFFHPGGTGGNQQGGEYMWGPPSDASQAQGQHSHPNGPFHPGISVSPGLRGMPSSQGQAPYARPPEWTMGHINANPGDHSMGTMNPLLHQQKIQNQLQQDPRQGSVGRPMPQSSHPSSGQWPQRGSFASFPSQSDEQR